MSHLLSKSFWRSYKISIRRSTRDKRDLKAACLISLGLLLFVGYYGTLIWNFFRLPDGKLILTPAILLGSTILFIRWLSERRDQRAIDKEDEAAADQGLRAHLAQDAYFISVLLIRAGSEQSLKDKELPQEVTVITRRIQIERLRKLGKWETLPTHSRILLLLPDGHWSGNQIHSVRKCFEILRCLRWVLGIDSELTPLTHVPKLNYNNPQQLFDKPEKLLDGKRLLPAWDIRVERNRADEFFGRCFAEAIGRGLMQSHDPMAEKWASEVYEAMREPYVRDTLAGIHTIAEIEDAFLLNLTWTSYHRHQCLQLIMDFEDGTDKVEEWQSLCFPQAPTVEIT
jgi:hypothetical protein